MVEALTGPFGAGAVLRGGAGTTRSTDLRSRMFAAVVLLVVLPLGIWMAVSGRRAEKATR